MAECITIDLLIDNQAVSSDDYLDVIDPGRFDEVVGRVALATTEQVEAAVDSAHRAGLAWRKTAFDERVKYLQRIADIVEQQIPALLKILVREQGMLPFFIERELKECVHLVADTIEQAKTALQPDTFEDETSKAVVYKKPWGVIAAIVPWNAPIILTMAKLVPALLAGNTVVVKPSPNAPLGVSTLLKHIAQSLPAGVLNVIHGDAAAGQTLTSHPRVRKISFTGGGATATHIMKSAAEGIKGVQLELGGNDPALVLADADASGVARELINSAFGRSGQFCFATKRIYVADAIYEAFVDAFCEAADAFCIGHPESPETTFGPVNNRAGFEHVERLVSEARDQGARVIELGTVLEPENWHKGYYRKPTVIADATQAMSIVSEEQFGPAIPIIRFDSEDAAVAMANATEFGLSASVWSADSERAIALAESLECGRVYINSHRAIGIGHGHMPFGGVKQSGLGWEQGPYGINEYIEYHSINYAKQCHSSLES